MQKQETLKEMKTNKQTNNQSIILVFEDDQSSSGAGASVDCEGILNISYAHREKGGSRSEIKKD